MADVFKWHDITGLHASALNLEYILKHIFKNKFANIEIINWLMYSLLSTLNLHIGKYRKIYIFFIEVGSLLYFVFIGHYSLETFCCHSQ